MCTLLINKYKIYFVVISIFIGFTIFPKAWKTYTYNKTKGIVRYFLYKENESSRRKTKTFYPLVDFTVKNTNYTCLGSSFQHEEIYRGDTVSVIYNEKDPEQAYVYTFLGFWGPTLVYFIPIALIISLGFGLDYIPKIIKIKL